MQSEIFAIADAATEAGGKLNILGSFDTIFIKELPTVFPMFTIAAKIRAFRGEPTVHKLQITILDPKERPVLEPFRTNITFSFVPESNSSVANVMLNLQGVNFPELGQYSIQLAVDGQMMIAIPLLIRKQP